jgi:hypothetical protein
MKEKAEVRDKPKASTNGFSWKGFSVLVVIVGVVLFYGINHLKSLSKRESNLTNRINPRNSIERDR